MQNMVYISACLFKTLRTVCFSIQSYAYFIRYVYSVPSVIFDFLQLYGLQPARLQSCLCPLPLSPASVHGIFQERTLEWVVIPSFRRSYQPRDRTSISQVSCIAGRFFIAEPPEKTCIRYIPMYLVFFFLILLQMVPYLRFVFSVYC